MNWGASYLINDLYKRYIRPGKSERHYLSVAKWAVLISVILAGLAAYYTESVTSAFQFIIAFGAGTGLVYILRWFWWRINAWTEISAMIASSVISIALYLTTDMDFALKVLITAGGSAVVWVIVAYLTPPVEREVLKNFYLRVRPGGFWKPVKELAGVEADTLGPAILNWVMGTAVVLGLTTGLGKFLMYRDLAGGAILICSLILAFLLYFRINPHTDQSAPRRMKMYS
jgi:hypothetical protein